MSTCPFVCDSFGADSILRLANGQLIKMDSISPGMFLLDSTDSPVRVKSLLVNEFYRGSLIVVTPTLALTPDHFLMTRYGWWSARKLVDHGHARWLPGFAGTVYNIILENGCSVLDAEGCAASAINADWLPDWFPTHSVIFLTREIRVWMEQERLYTMKFT